MTAEVRAKVPSRALTCTPHTLSWNCISNRKVWLSEHSSPMWWAWQVSLLVSYRLDFKTSSLHKLRTLEYVYHSQCCGNVSGLTVTNVKMAERKERRSLCKFIASSAAGVLTKNRTLVTCTLSTINIYTSCAVPVTIFCTRGKLPCFDL